MRSIFKRSLGFTRIACLLWGLGACSSLLYAPQSTMISSPRYFGLDFEEFTVVVDSPFPHAIRAWWIRGKNSEGHAVSRDRPLVVQFHGNAENMSTHFQLLLWLPREGYDLVTFDYGGYGQSEGSPSPESTVKEGLALLEWVHRRAPERRIVVIGQSLGGAVAARALLENRKSIQPVPIAWLVLESTFHSYVSVGRRVLARQWLTWPFQGLSYLALSDRWAPGKEVALLSPLPVLVVHGIQDPVIPFAAGKQLFEKLGEPKEFWSFPVGGHLSAFWVDGLRFRTAFLTGLAKMSNGKAPSLLGPRLSQ